MQGCAPEPYNTIAKREPKLDSSSWVKGLTDTQTNKSTEVRIDLQFNTIYRLQVGFIYRGRQRVSQNSNKIIRHCTTSHLDHHLWKQ